MYKVNEKDHNEQCACQDDSDDPYETASARLDDEDDGPVLREIDDMDEVSPRESTGSRGLPTNKAESSSEKKNAITELDNDLKQHDLWEAIGTKFMLYIPLY